MSFYLNSLTGLNRLWIFFIFLLFSSVVIAHGVTQKYPARI
jgi:hypothetical protein